jgi:hypothetical protein
MKNWILLLLMAATYPVAAQRAFFPVEIKGKWGYMNAEGKMVLPAVYDYADDFYEGVAVVAVKNLPCLIDEKGKRLVDTGLYENISHVSEGLSAVTDYNKRKFYINTKGEKVITLAPDIYEARVFSEGIAVVSKQLEEHQTKFGRDISTLGYRFAYINNKGEYITEFVYDDADEARKGLARVRTGTKFGLIDTKGATVLKPAYNNIGNFNEDMAVVDANGKFGYINTKGELVIKTNYNLGYNFTDGLAAVWINGKFGFINKAGELKIPAIFDQVKPFSEGRAGAMKDGKWGFIDASGNWVLRNVFDNTSVFSEGMCAVLIKKYWGFIDMRGALVIPAEYDAVGSFHDGVADVVYRDINLYVNQRGQLLPILDKSQK